MSTARNECEALVSRLAEALGRPLILDYASCYGGYRIVEPAGEHGGIGTATFGDVPRCPAGEMARRLRFALRAVEAVQ